MDTDQPNDEAKHQYLGPTCVCGYPDAHPSQADMERAIANWTRR